jgi:hypothetical protein
LLSGNTRDMVDFSFFLAGNFIRARNFIGNCRGQLISCSSIQGSWTDDRDMWWSRERASAPDRAHQWDKVWSDISDDGSCSVEILRLAHISASMSRCYTSVEKGGKTRMNFKSLTECIRSVPFQWLDCLFASEALSMSDVSCWWMIFRVQWWNRVCSSLLSVSGAQPLCHLLETFSRQSIYSVHALVPTRTHQIWQILVTIWLRSRLEYVTSSKRQLLNWMSKDHHEDL